MHNQRGAKAQEDYEKEAKDSEPLFIFQLLQVKSLLGEFCRLHGKLIFLTFRGQVMSAMEMKAFNIHSQKPKLVA